MRIPPCGNYGDIDGDGYVTGADAQHVLDYSAGETMFTPTQRAAGDVSGDGVTNSLDAMTINRYAAGEVGTFPVCIEYTSPTAKMIRVFAVAAVIMYVLIKLIWK